MPADAPTPTPYKNILFCTDFSANADFAFDFAIREALGNPGATLTLLHVIPEPDAQFWKGYIYEVGDMDAKARADIDAKIEHTYRPRIPQSVPFQIKMQVGSAAKVILEYADATHADLIILGRQGRGALSRWLMGNVTGKVACKATCPVLIIPAQAD